MTLLKSIKDFIMSVVKAMQESQAARAAKYTRSYRLDKYLESKGCKEVSCVEHWIREFDRQEAKHGF